MCENTVVFFKEESCYNCTKTVVLENFLCVSLNIINWIGFFYSLFHVS